MITILGAGLSGLSCSYHIGHNKCVLFESNSYAGGHIFSHHVNGYVWDEGPHVSFTKHPYVRQLFQESVQGEFLEYECRISNYHEGVWIPHPAQTNLYAIPEPLRSSCYNDFLKARKMVNEDETPSDYAAWLEQAFGATFASNFPKVYTRKYWACNPEDLATDWIGERIYYPDIETVRQGYHGLVPKGTHYISNVRYPKKGGYISFSNKIRKGANIHFNHHVEHINFKQKLITFKNGFKHSYQRLINTLPLPELIRLASDVPNDIRDAASKLNCTSLLLVNVTANHSECVPYHWCYVYDENILSTRINHINLLSPNNVPSGKTGIQVEVYESKYRPFKKSHEEIASTVIKELQIMGLIKETETVHTKYMPYANVMFDQQRRKAQNKILSWLQDNGLIREKDDLDPITKWNTDSTLELGDLALAGRFGQWKYFWTDDCILRGKAIAKIWG